MNNDIISRKALKKTMWDESHSIATFTECGTEEARLGLTIDEVGHIIDEAPTVEQECYITGAQWNEFIMKMKEHKRPHGEWIFGSTLGHGWMKCSNCCVSQSGQTSCWSYCPNCGADMRKEE